MRCGGLSVGHGPTAEDIAVLHGVRAEINRQFGRSVSRLEALSVATQVVAGLNYFFKARVDDEVAHLRIFRSLQGTLQLVAVQRPKTLTDPLDYF